MDQEPESKKWRRSLKAFESRLHWRDHFIQRLEAFPNMENHPINKAYAALEYEDDADLLEAWRLGANRGTHDRCLHEVPEGDGVP